MTKPQHVSFDVHEIVRRDRDYWRKRARQAEAQAQQNADELAEVRRQSHAVANKRWGDNVINGRW